MRVAYYAVGGGLGHLVRARAFLHTLGLTRDAIVLTASPFAADPRVAGTLAMHAVPAALEQDIDALRDWLRRALATLVPAVLCVDAFPGGILGELCGFALPAGVEAWHVARLLHWPRYAALLRDATPHYSRCWRTEPLAPVHEDCLLRCCTRIDDIELVDDVAPRDEVAVSRPRANPGEPFWLVAHSGPAAEVAELAAFADEMRAIERNPAPLWIASPQPPSALPANSRIVDAHPLHALYHDAERLFTAAGFNTMRQTRAWRGKQRVLPMPRRFDDQFERARRAFAGGRDRTLTFLGRELRG
jgi:hypothetical protein